MDYELKKIEDKLKAITHEHVESIPLYPGIDLYYFSTTTELASVQHPPLEHIMEINYCRIGRLGWKMKNGNQIYLGPGDFSLHTLDACTDSTLSFPTEKYEGLTLCIDFQELSACPPEPLAQTGISRKLFEKKYWQNGAFASFAGNTQTDLIFSAFYGQPEELKLAYQKIKSIELLLHLIKIETGQKRRLTEYQSEQVEIVRKIHEHLTAHIGERITIESLSRKYLINPTTLKSMFKSVYGNSLAAHIKEHRMELAAELLLETDLSMAEIGQRIGYESQSKFTAAFKAYYQILPKEYRKNSYKMASRKEP